MPRTRGERAGLTLPAVVEAARELLDERGIAGLAMRPVAERLGVAPNSLYSYVADKGALLDAVLDDLIAGIDVPAASIAPRSCIETIMVDSFDALVRHPDLAAITLARQGSGGANAWRLGDAILHALDQLGVPESAARDGLRILLSHMMGTAAFATQYDARLGGRAHRTVDAHRADYVVALGWLLDGIIAGRQV
ncbi:MAG: TetR family transcriptional regulator [Rhodoglobus sp.]